MTSKDNLLQVTFEEIYENGYYATSVDKILKKAKMNKGSMYHYFKSKKELVLAVIDVHISQYIEKKYGAMLEVRENYIDEMIKIVKKRDTFNFICGCRLNSLVQELSHQDADFKIALEKVYIRFENIFEEAIIKAIEQNEIKHENPKNLSVFIVASLEGCLSTAKKSQDGEIFSECITQLEIYLNQLKV